MATASTAFAKVPCTLVQSLVGQLPQSPALQASVSIAIPKDRPTNPLYRAEAVDPHSLGTHLGIELGIDLGAQVPRRFADQFARQRPGTSNPQPQALIVLADDLDAPELLQRAALPHCLLLTLQPQQDAFRQIQTILDHYPSLTQLHLLCHGAPGQLFLNAADPERGTLSLETLSLHRSTLQSWQRLGLPSPAHPPTRISDPDPAAGLYLYGCNVAQGDLGQAFLQALHGLIRVPIYASTTPIGSPQHGGDWHLDRAIGFAKPRRIGIHTTPNETPYPPIPSLPFHSQQLWQYPGLFNLPPVLPPNNPPNDPLNPNGLAPSEVALGDNIVITKAMLRVTDEDTLPGEIIYVLTAAPRFGNLILDVNGTSKILRQAGPDNNNQSPGPGDVFSFTQADIDAGRLSYRNDAGAAGDDENPDSFQFAIADGDVIQRVSVTSSGQEGLGGGSLAPEFSGNSRYVVFQSAANNLVSGDTNNAADIFRYDLQTRTIERVSVGLGGVNPTVLALGSGGIANTSSTQPNSANPDVSDDGNHIAFDSIANNLVVGDTNGVVAVNGTTTASYRDVFVYNHSTQTTRLVSVNTDGSQATGPVPSASLESRNASISGDGQRIVFESNASNLASAVIGGNESVIDYDIFLSRPTTADPNQFELIRLSIGRDSNNNPVKANGESLNASISKDGNFVVFESNASNLVTGDTNGATDIFVYDVANSQLSRLPISNNFTGVSKASISRNGRYVVFQASDNLDAADTNNTTDIYLFDRQTNTLTLVSVNAAGQAANNASSEPIIDDNGTTILFLSSATDLRGVTTNSGSSELYQYVIGSGTIQRVSIQIEGQPSGVGVTSGDFSTNADGTAIAFSSSSTSIIPLDTNGQTDVFVLDTQTIRSTKEIKILANQAPVLVNPNTPTFVTINEDATTSGANASTATSVNDLLIGVGLTNIRDPFDPARPNTTPIKKGIAVTAVDTTQGTWQFSVDGGTTWAAISLGANQVLLLGADDDPANPTSAANQRSLLRFIPNANYFNTIGATPVSLLPSITFRAWDQTGKTKDRNGQYFDLSELNRDIPFGGTTPFSGDADVDNNGTIDNDGTITAAIRVIAVNDAPTAALTPGSNAVTVEEDSTNPVTGISFADVDLDFVTDDATRIFQATLTTVGGRFTASNGAGVTVSGSNTATLTLSGSLSAINAFLAAGSVSYTPPLNVTTPQQIKARLNDQGNIGSGGNQLSNEVTIDVTIIPINDQPVLGATTGNLTNPGISEDTRTEITIAQLIASLGANPITDPDEPSNAQAKGIAITALSNQGTWEYTIDGGTTWIAVPANLSATNALQLANDANTRLRFSPNLNVNGVVSTGIGFKAWDRSNEVINGVPGPSLNGTVANPSADLATNGAKSAFSTATATTGFTILAVNDAPVNTVPGSQTVAEDGLLTFSAATGNAISIDDVDIGTGEIEVTLRVTNGTIRLANDPAGLSELVLTGTLAEINDLLANGGVIFQPDANYNGPALLTIITSDQGNTPGPAQIDTDTVAITVTPVNDAPVLAATGSLTLANGSEDTQSVFTVAQLIAALGSNAITDVDILANPAAGVAVTALDSSNGIWEVSTNGTTWTPVSLNVDQGLLLVNDATTALRFTPNPDFNGSLANAITLRAWDRSNDTGAPLNGTTVAIAATGGITPYSTATAQLSFSLSAVNDAPVNTVPVSTPAIQLIEETPLAFTGVRQISIADPDLVGAFANDPTKTIQVSLSIPANTGILSVTTTGQANVGAIGNDSGSVTLTGPLSQINAVLATLVYTPPLNFRDTTVVLTLVTNDQGNIGSPGNLSDTDTITIRVVPSNFAPVLDISGSPVLPAVAEDVTAPNGLTINELIAQLGGTRITDDNDPSGQVPDPTKAQRGIAVTAVDNSNGTWQYSLDGTTWSNFGSPSDAQARLLAASDTQRIRFVPAPNFNGSIATGLSFRAWDQVSGSNGGTADASVNGLFTSFSAAVETVGITVTPVNDAPVLVAGVNAALGSLAEDTANPAGITVASLVGGLGTNAQLSDVDTGALQGIALTGIDSSNGRWQFSTDSGATWQDLTGISPSAALLLSATTSNQLRFIPNANFNGSANLSFRAWDQTSGTNGGSADTTTNGGTTAFSIEVATGTLAITAVNDAPTLPNLPTQLSITEDTPTALSGIVLADVDAGTGVVKLTLGVDAGSLAIAPNTAGVTVDPTSTATQLILTGNLTDVNAAIAAITYTPALNATANATLSVTLDDQGNVGSGGPLTVQGNVTLAIAPVNDAPTLPNLPTQLSITEDTPTLLSGIVLADGDAGTGVVKLTLGVDAGSLAIAPSTPGVTVDPTSTATQLILTGNLTDLNAAIAAITYSPALNATTNATLSVTLDDQGNTGSGGPLNAQGTVTLAIAPVNDAPTLTVPTSISVTEDVASPLSGIVLADLDAGTGVVKLTLGVDSGSLAIAPNTAGVTVDPTSTATQLILTGNLTDLNAAIAANAITYTTATNASTAATLTVNLNDQGNSGSGGALSDQQTLSLTINAVNDAPTLTGPTQITVTEDVASALSGITLTDVDAGAGIVRLTLAVDKGSLAIAPNTTGVTVDPTSTATQLILTGTLAALNGAIATNAITYQTVLDDITPASLTVTLNDQGNTGSGGPLSSSSLNLSLTVSAVNDAPTLTAPDSINVPEDTITPLNGISFADVDAGSASVTVEFSVTTGTLSTVTLPNGVTQDPASTSTRLILNGSLSALNSLINTANGVLYDPPANAGQAGVLTVQISDNGNSGSGGPKTASKVIQLSDALINDAPVNQLPVSQNLTEDTPFVFSQANGNAIRVSDIDAGTGNLRVTLSATQGTLTLAGTTGLTNLSGNGTASLDFTGTLTDLNAALNGLTFTPTANANGAAGITITTSDLGNTGDGGPKSDTDTLNLTIQAVNDAPVLDASTGFVLGAIAEDTLNPTGTTVASLLGTRLSDIDASALQGIAITAAEGTNGTWQYRLTSTDAWSNLGTVSASAARLLAATAEIRFVPNAHFNGSATLSFRGWDQTSGVNGNTADTATTGGTSAFSTALGSASITVSPVNDAPTITVPTANLRATEATTDPLRGFSFADIDAGSGSVTVTLSVGNGTLAAISGNGVTATVAPNGLSLTLSGTVTQINDFISTGNVSYTPGAIASSLTIAINDNGNSGSGGALSASQVVPFQLVPLNDAPVLDISGTPTLDAIAEDATNPAGTDITTLISRLAGITDPDATDGNPDDDAINARRGLAIVAADNSNGTWQFSTDSGSTWTPVGSLSDSRALLLADASTNRLRFVPNPNFNGTVNLQLRAWDQSDDLPNGSFGDARLNGGRTAFSTAIETASLAVTAVNDAPVNTIPNPSTNPQSLNEDGTLLFSSATGNAITISDVDAGTSPVRVTLTTTQGTLQPGSSAGVTVTGLNTGTLQLDGTITAINAALNGLVFTPTANFNGAASLQILTTDLGNTGSGGAQTDTDAIAITVIPINDAPVLDTSGNPSLGAIAEDTPSPSGTLITNLLSQLGGTGITDVDANAQRGIAITSADSGNGTWQFSTNGGSTWTNLGSVSTTNARLLAADSQTQIRFIPNPNFFGNASFNVRAWDQTTGTNGGNADTTTNGGTSAFSSTTELATITVTPVNDAPLNLLPTTQNVKPNQTLTFSSANGNALRIADIDAGTGEMLVTLSLSGSGNGSLTVPNAAGVTTTGNTSASVQLRGTVTAINAALNGLAFTPTANFQGGVQLTIATNDQGNTGGTVATGLIATNVLDIIVDEINDAPVLDTTGNPSFDPINEDTLTGQGLTVSQLIARTAGITDPDPLPRQGLAITAADNSNGTWQYSTDGGTTWTNLGSPSTSAARLLSDAATNRIRFIPAPNFNGSVANGLSFRAWDQTSGVTGGTADTTTNGGNTAFSSAIATASISVTPVNDAPVNTVPGPQILTEDTILNLSGANGFQISDVDAGTGELQVTLTATNGTLNLSNSAGVTVGGANSANLVLTGSVTALNTALNTLQFTPTANYSGPAQITILTNDQGNTGGAAQTDSDTINLTITAVNDAPVLTPAANLVLPALTEDIGTSLASNPGLTIPALIALVGANGITDADTGALSGIAITGLNSANGQWQFSLDDGQNWTDVGAVSEANARLLGATATTRLRFVPNANFNGTLSNAIAFRAWDQTSGVNGGLANAVATGGSTAFSANLQTANLTITPVNDAPVNTVPGQQTVLEDNSLVLSGASAIRVSDVESGDLRVTLAASNGILQLGSSLGLTSVTGNGSATVVLTGSQTALNSALDGLRFTPSANFSGNAQISVTTNDLANGGTPAQEVVNTVAIAVTGVNDAPILTPVATLALPSLSEDPQVNTGLTIPDLITLLGANGITDADTGALQGIAITNLNTSNGTWEFSLDNGATWTPTLPPSPTAALLLSADANTRLRFVPNANFNGTLSNAIAFRAWDQTTGVNGGTANTTTTGGSSAFSTALQTASLTITPVNDAPTIQLPTAALSLAEDGSLALSGSNRIQIGDVDAGTAPVQLTLQTSAGTLSLSDTTGLSVTGNGSGTVVLTGSLTNLNLALDTLSFSPTANFSGNAGITITVNDQGNSPAPAQTTTVNLGITVTAVNDAPILLANGQGTLAAIAEDTPTASLTGTLVSDLITSLGANGYTDADSTPQRGIAITTLSDTTNGTWEYSLDGTTWQAIGTVSDTNARLLADTARIRFVPNADFYGDISLSFRGWDQTTGVNGGTANPTPNGGSTAFSTLSNTATLSVTPVNDAPVNTVPGTQTVFNDTSLVFAAANGNAIALQDDSGDGLIEVSLSVDQGGILSLASLTNVFITGGANDSASVTLQGTLTDINAALDALRFIPTANFVGTATLTVTTDDQGEAGGGPALTDTDAITINIGNNPIPNTAPSFLSTTASLDNIAEDVTNPAGTAIADLISQLGIDDTDTNALSGVAITAASASAGTWQFSTNGGTTWQALGTPRDTAARLLSDAATNRIRLIPSLNFNGTIANALTLRAWDQASGVNGGIGDASRNGGTTAFSSNNAIAGITVTPVNDAPTITIPTGAIAVTEDTTTNLTGISFADVDGIDSNVQVSLAIAAGILITSGVAASFIDPSSTPTRLVLNGTIAEINGLISNGQIRFRPADNATGNETLTIQINDLANGGSPALTTTQAITLAIAPVNDAPLNTVPGLQILNEDTPLIFSTTNGNAIQVSDIDAGTAAIRVQLSATNGTLTPAATTNLTVSGDGTGVVDLIGSQADINAALNGLQYSPTANFNGSAQITVITSDRGNTGSGGTLEDTDTISLTINAVNDAPVLTANQTLSLPALDEDVTNSTGITIPDLLAQLGAGALTDVDTNPLSGIAITAINTTNGTWEYSTDGGTAWQSLTGVSVSAARLLASTATNRIRFVPAADFNGSVSGGLTLRAWDQMTGSDGGTADTTINGGSTAFSTNTATVGLTVNPINDAPVNTLPATFTLAEDDTLNFTGANVIQISDIDAGSNPLSVSIRVTSGNLQIGTTPGVTVSGNTSSLVSLSGSQTDLNTALASLTFSPLANFNGPVTLELTTDDQGATGATGPLQAVSTATITVNSVNDAPILSADASLNPIPEDSTNPLGQTLSSLFGSAYSDPDTPTTALPSLAVLGNSANPTTQGTWQYSLDGTTWNDIGTVSPSSALLLAAATQVRFVPVANFNGTPPALSVKALDTSFSGGFTTGANRVTLDTTAIANATLVSTDTRALNAAIAPVADVSAISSTTPDGLYKTGDQIILTVQFDEVVTVSGQPQLLLETGSSDRAATFLDGNGTSTLRFSYTVQAGDTSADLDYLSTSALSLNGGSITNAAGLAAHLVLPSPGATGSLGANKALVIDTTAPTITAIALPSDGIYRSGQTLDFSLTFSEAVNLNPVGGSVLLPIALDGGQTVNAVLTGLSNGNTQASFRYTVAAGDNDLDGISLANLSLASGTTLRDAAGNDTLLGLPTLNSSGIQIDTLAPILTLNTSSGPLTNQQPIAVNATLSEALSDFDATDLVVTGGDIIGFSGTGTTYSFSIIPTSDDTAINVSLKPNVLSDRAGNAAQLTAPLDLRFDSRRPTVTLTSTAPASVTGSFDTTATFSEVIQSFTASQIEVIGSAVIDSVTNPSGDNRTFIITTRATDNGNVTLRINPNAVTDLAGNSNDTSADLSRTLVLGPPSVVLSSTSPTLVNAPFTVTATFSQAVTGLLESELSVTNGSIVAGSLTTTDNRIYSFQVTPSSDGAVSVTIPAGVVQDSANNLNLAAAQPLTRTFDGTAPSLTLSSTTTDPFNGDLLVTATFSETVNGFDSSDLVLTNGSLVANSFTANPDGKTFTFAIAPTSDGTVSVGVNANAALDLAANANTAATPISRTSDRTLPTLTSLQAPTGPFNAAFTVTATFSEAVTDFALADLNVTNGTASNLQPVANSNGTSYTFTVTPTASGNVSVAIAPDAVLDAAQNRSNLVNANLSRTADLDVPTVVLASTSNATIRDRFLVTADFSETVTGFSESDLVVANGSVVAGSLQLINAANALYQFEVQATASGAVTVQLPAATVQDNATNPNQASNSLSRTADLTPPSLSLSSPAAAQINGPIQVTLSSNEPITGLTLSDFVVTNGVASNLVDNNNNTFTVTVTPDAAVTDADLSVSVAANALTDSVGNPNPTPLNLTRRIDRIAPTVSFTTDAPATVGGVFQATLTFSEAVSGLQASDFTVTNGGSIIPNGIGAIATTDGGLTYSVDIVPAANGAIAITLGANTVNDLAGNTNATPSTTLNRTVNLSPPSAILSTPKPLVNGEFEVTATFDQLVSGLLESEIVVNNGSVVPNSLTFSNGRIYTFRVIPSSDGPVTINLPAGVVQDSFNRNNTASTPLNLSADLTAPTLTLTSTTTDPFNGNLTVTASFSEVVTGFDTSDLVLTNGSLVGPITADLDGKTFTFAVAPTSDGVVSVDVQANAAQDNAGNGSLDVAPLSRTSDRTLPTLVSLDAPTGPFNAAFTVTATFSETVTDFALTDVNVTNGTASNLQPVANSNGASYTFTVTPAASGNVSVAIAPDAVLDAAQNRSNLQNASLTRTADLNAPTLSLTSATVDPFNGNLAVTATFNEAVTGFDASDLVLTNGTVVANSFTANPDGRTFTFNVAPTSDGLVSVGVNANAAQDLAGNASTAATSISRTSDRTLPTLTSLQADPGPFNAPFTVTATFSETVTDFALNDLTVTNGTASNLQPVANSNGTSYTFTLTPTTSGDVTVAIAPDAVLDTAQNRSNLQNVNLTRVADLIAPTLIALTSTVPSGTTVSGPFEAIAIFSEAVTGLTASDFVVTNGGRIENIQTTDDGTSYTFTVVPVNDGSISVSLPNTIVTDLAGNPNTPSSRSFSRNALLAPPGVTLTTATSAVNGVFSVTASFTQVVSGLLESEINVTNGTVVANSLISSDGGLTYSFNVTPSADGTVSISLPANVAQNAGGRTNTASNTVSRTADITRPTVLLSRGPINFTAGTFEVTASFSEAVTGFDPINQPGDLNLTNATVVAGSLRQTGNAYTFTVQPIIEGIVGVQITDGAAQDGVNNLNQASALLNVGFTRTPPEVASLQINRTLLNQATVGSNVLQLTVTFDSAMNTAVAPSFSFPVENPSAGLFFSGGQWQGDRTYIANFSLIDVDQTLANIDVQVTNAQNAFGTPMNARSFANLFSIDTAAPGAPVITGFSADTGISGGDRLTADNTLIVFGAAEAGSTVSLFINGSFLGNTAVTANGTWGFDATALALGSGVYYFAAIATDAAGNQSGVSAPFDVTVDTLAPVANFAGVSSPSRTPVDSLFIQFSEAVVGVDTSDFLLYRNGQLVGTLAGAGIASSNGSGYSLSGLSGLTQIPATYQVVLGASAGIFDYAGNPFTNTASVSWQQQGQPNPGGGFFFPRR